MSWKKFEDECPGCRPALMDTKTGKALSDDHPTMKIIQELWAETTKAEREAFHRLTCQNSRAEADLDFMGSFIDKLQGRLRN